jgi:hypothetical protein
MKPDARLPIYQTKVSTIPSYHSAARLLGFATARHALALKRRPAVAILGITDIKAL